MELANLGLQLNLDWEKIEVLREEGKWEMHFALEIGIRLVVQLLTNGTLSNSV